ncbi:type 4 pilus major pilin [Cupriavidus taiwanensis]|uniref:Putative type IV pilin protein n=2 Tax=Cupriavidus taiwanensis TaxID=164546 RepID=A0A7Z7NQ59_9BURK|nr:type 4 pilus major pilin [Cupriavidus taiwanensis]SOZ17224.1 putative type IV pilin protein [Cupriavidus taiwanensis]SOZ96448.1 putative type IV pilin protein [Cupriavidus taiwanensis]SPC25607.1 putative type IV pilin protein [Cupriavidus taiwanensis]
MNQSRTFRKINARSIRKQQGGFTLVELLIAAVLLALGIAGIYKGVSDYMSNDRANREMKELPSIITAIQQKYAQRQNYAGATTAGLINLGVFPQSWVVGATVQNRWGGTVTVGTATLVSANDALTLSFTQVPQAECADVIPGVEQNVRVVTVGGTSVKANNAQTDMTALGTACAAGGVSNTVVYTIGKA